MALRDSTLWHPIRSIIQYLILITLQVLVAVIMTIIANKFDVCYLGDVTILILTVLSIGFCVVSTYKIIVRILFVSISIFVSLITQGFSVNSRWFIVSFKSPLHLERLFPSPICR